MSLEKIDASKLSKMIGENIADSSVGAIFAVNDKKKVNENTYALIIGVGGNGGKTVNAIKRNFKESFIDWERKVAFLAIDTEENGLRYLNYLDYATETLYLAYDNGVSRDRWLLPERRTPFAKTWLNPRFSYNIEDSKGASRVREVAKARLYDTPRTGIPNDEALRRKIDTIMNSKLSDIGSNKLQVIIILGVSGGTGSGLIIDVPHIVRSTKFGNRAEIYGYFFMPDTCEEYVAKDDDLNSFYENGYAALKELEYYNCVRQREGYSEDFLTNNMAPKSDGAPLTHNDKLYDLPFIVNAPDIGRGKNAASRNAIVETVTNLFTAHSQDNTAGNSGTDDNNSNTDKGVYLMSAWIANVEKAREDVFRNHFDGSGDEAPGFFAEDSTRYCAIGVGTASIPDRALKSYTITRVANVLRGKAAHPLKNDFRGFSMVPLTSVQADTLLYDLLIPNEAAVEDAILERCHVTWKDSVPTLTRNEIAGDDYATLPDEFNENIVQGDAINGVDGWLGDEFERFKKGAKAIIQEYGPRAFVNLAKGVSGSETYDGILKRVEKLGVDSLTGSIDPGSAKAAMDQRKKKIKNWAVIFTAIKEWRSLDNEIANWRSDYLNWRNMVIAENVKKHVLGDGASKNGSLYTRYINKVKEFVEGCEDFAFILDKIMDNYAKIGADFANYESFINTNDITNYNIISKQSSYNWAKEIADKTADMADIQSIKMEIVDGFFEHPENWIGLGNENVPGSMPARDSFDRIIAKYINFKDEANKDSLSIVAFIEHSIADGTTFDATISGIVSGAIDKAKLLYQKSSEASPGLGAETMYLLVPNIILSGENGKKIKETIDNNLPDGCNILASYVTDKIVCYKLCAALPMYAIADLPKWYDKYRECRNSCIHGNESGKGDFDPETGLEWFDYPELILSRKDRIPDRYGAISKEGKFLLNVFDPLWKQAVEAGIIAECRDNSSEYYYEFYSLGSPELDGIADAFNINKYQIGSDGMYHKGKELVEHLVALKQHSIEAHTKQVRLGDMNCKFNQHDSNEERALEYAKRSLRRNVKMYLDVKKTLARLSPVLQQIDTANSGTEGLRKWKAEIESRKLIAKFIAFGQLTLSGNTWSVPDYPRTGDSLQICRMLEIMFKRDPVEYDQFKLGMQYWLLCSRVLEKLKNDGRLENELHKRSEKDYEDLTTGKLKGSDCLERLEGVKAECEEFVEKYNGQHANSGDQNDLIDSIKLDYEVDPGSILDGVIEVYNEVSDWYNSIVPLCE